MDTKICKRCNKSLPLDSFTRGHNKEDKSIEYIRNVCYRCQYGWNTFWKNATEEEKTERLDELFNNRVVKKDGCWDFNGNTGSRGYFEIKIGGRVNPKSLKAHRVSWIIHKGSIPEGKCVLHRCDNKRCANPEHLFLGTPLDNAIDREQKQRGNHAKGERNGNSILNVKQVKKIKRLLNLGVPVTKIASDFKVGNSTIYHIKYGHSWKEVRIYD